MDWCWLTNSNDFVMVDAGSGWVEAFESSTRTSEVVIKFLRAIFSRFGIPQCLVSDNAPEFVLVELTEWLRRQGIRKIESPPYNPSSNGLAERGVRIVKDAMRTFDSTKQAFTFGFRKFYFIIAIQLTLEVRALLKLYLIANCVFLWLPTMKWVSEYVTDHCRISKSSQ